MNDMSIQIIALAVLWSFQYKMSLNYKIFVILFYVFSNFDEKSEL